MMDMLWLYRWNLVCGSLNAIALALYGSQIAARGRSVQSLAIGQAATFGVLVGAALFPNQEHSELSHWLCPLFGFAVASGAFFLSERLLRRQRSARSSSLVSFFALLLALTYLVVHLLPGLDSHMAQSFFGDLVTVAGVELWSSLSVACVALIWFLFHRRRIVEDSFQIAVFGENQRRSSRDVRLFAFAYIALISGSIFALGLLFTLTMLFLPTTLLANSRRASLEQFFAKICLVALSACVLGIVITLFSDRLPTVPSVTVAVLGLGGASLLFERFIQRKP